MKIVMAGLAVSYPLAAHLAVSRASEPLTLLSLTLLAAIVFLPGLARGKQAAWISAACTGLALIVLARADAVWLPLYAPPVLINFLMAWIFGRSLFSGRTSLIERFVHLLHPAEEPLDAAVPAYARRLTLAWTVLFVILGTLNLLLALFAAPNGILLWLGATPAVTVPREVWSLFANLFNYLIVGAFFAVEYAWRRHRFPQQPYANMLDFIRRTIALGPRVFGIRGSA